MTLRLVLVERGPRRKASRRAYHRRVMEGVRGQAFIGRTAELERLVAGHARAAAGGSGVVIVAGEAGIGKSRLVDAFCHSPEVAGSRVLSGGCLPPDTGSLPYGPFVEAFRDLLRDVDPGALPALLGPNRRELARLIPEVRGRNLTTDATVADAPGAPDGDAADDPFAQVRLFELVFGVIERLARVSPVILVVEDLQWADPSTRALVGFLVRNLRDERVMLIATVRTDEPDPRHESLGFLAELERAERVDHIDVGRLDRPDLARLVEDELGAPPSPALVDRILDRTDGNPFYVEQVVAVTRDLDDEALPPRLRDVVLARIALVSEGAQAILRIAWRPVAASTTGC